MSSLTDILRTVFVLIEAFIYIALFITTFVLYLCLYGLLLFIPLYVVYSLFQAVGAI